MNENVTINELTARVTKEMCRMGYSEETIWRDYHPKFGQVSAYYQRTGKVFYSLDTTAEFVQLQLDRAKTGDISPTSLNTVLNAETTMHNGGAR